MNLYLLLTLLFFVLSLAGLWGIFEKSGYKGWMSIVPFYNLYIWLRIIKKPLWWYIFLLIPFINVFVILLMTVEICKCFKKYDLGAQALGVLFPFAYLPYLGFSKKESYLDPAKRPVIKKTFVREWVDAIIFAVIAASIIRIFLIEAYTIPTSSMEKTLLVGDYLFVSKVNFGPGSQYAPLLSICAPYASSHRSHQILRGMAGVAVLPLPGTSEDQEYGCGGIQFPGWRYPFNEIPEHGKLQPAGETVRKRSLVEQ